MTALVVAGCGGSHAPHSSSSSTVQRTGLAVGLTEANANLLWSPGARPAPAGFADGRARLSAMRPAYWRLALDWAAVQPKRGEAPQWDRRSDGCMRGLPPCAPFAGVRDELRAIATQQRAGGGFEVVVSLSGVPDWAAHAPSGCERAGTRPRSRPLRDDAVPDYRALVRSLLAIARAEGVELRWWSPWNEPNHPAFISPQRAHCRVRSSALAPGVYARLVRALATELDAAPGDQRIVLGDLAGLASPRRYGAGVAEFVKDLPEDVVCAGPVWAQHAYAGGGEGGPGAVDELERALARRGGCAARARIWVTETGSGAPHAGRARSRSDEQLRAGCRAMATALERWDRDPQVDVAFQYTFREDPAFPVGLMDATLTKAYPAYDVWRSWGARRTRDVPPLPPACGTG